MASTTKIMTALVAIEEGRLEDRVRIGPQAIRIYGSRAGLRAGQELRLEDLLHGLLLSSGNDAALAVAEHVAGSVEAFVERMNARARELGLLHTRFVNPHGLDAPGHYSTAYDLAQLARVALLHPTFARIVARKEYPIPPLGTWHNTNRLLWSFEGIEGVKTGTTGRAGDCLVAAASRSGMRLISVVLGSDNRWADTARLLEYGFRHYRVLTLARYGQVLAEVHLPLTRRPLAVVAADDVPVVLHHDEVPALQTRLVLAPPRPGWRAGDPVGWLQVHTDRSAYLVPLAAAAPARWWTPADLLRRLWPWGRSTPPPAPAAPPRPEGA